MICQLRSLYLSLSFHRISLSLLQDQTEKFEGSFRRMAANKAKKQTSVLEACVDTQIINTPGVGASVIQMCESVGVRCTTRDQLIAGTVTWQLSFNATEVAAARIEEMDDVLAIIPVDQFVAMVNSQAQSVGETFGQTLTEYVRSLQHIYSGKRLSATVNGLEKYFSDQKLEAKRKHREEVTGQKAKAVRKVQHVDGPSVSRFQVEEAIVVTQLETGCCCRLADAAQEVAELVKCYTKAVMEKPNKKDRFDSAFSFLEEGGAGVKADKTGAGLLKVWKLQLQQLHNLGPDMAAAIAAEFPSPLALKQAYSNYPNPADAWKVTENIVVRRGAGALETGRRVGQQLSRRIHTLMTSTDSNQIVK
ncbi:crossover junction endonuclease EME1-like isoform X2 [Littorina saxatilis]|uniref:crossover junction endonuclease EME1-like isoform X2 n=1 Tax=Littorina saxatilis TaxID=31220 RepID=UPI0038B63BED